MPHPSAFTLKGRCCRVVTARLTALAVILVFVQLHDVSSSGQRSSASTPGKGFSQANEPGDAALRAFTEGERLRSEWKEPSLRAALKKYDDARRLSKIKRDRRGEAVALKAIGDNHSTLGEYKKAAGPYRQALLISRRIKDQTLIADILTTLGEAEIDEAGSLAEKRFQEALKISESLNYTAGVARALNNLGLVAYILSDEPTALDYCSRALSLWKVIGDPRGEAETLTNMAYSFMDLGQVTKALAHHSEAAAIAKKAGNPRQEAIAKIGVGLTHTARGEMEQALDSYRSAAQALGVIGDRISQAAALNGLGSVYEQLGEWKNALACYRKAYGTWTDARQFRRAAVTLRLMGNVYESAGKHGRALLLYRDSMEMSRAAKDKQAVAYALLDIGSVHDTLGQPGLALDHYQQALVLCEDLHHPRVHAFALAKAGRAYHARGDHKKARALYDQALELMRVAGDRRGEALALHDIARLRRDTGDLNGAIELAKTLLEIVEAPRGSTSRRDLGASLFASTYSHYELYIDLLMQKHQRESRAGYDVLAFELCERGRARAFTETLFEAKLDIREGADRELIEKERELRFQLEAKANRQTDMLVERYALQRKIPRPNPGESQADIAAARSRNQTQLERIEEEINEITLELGRVEADIRRSNPRYAGLKAPPPLTLAQIQQELLDDDTRVLVYSLGDDRSYLWVIGRNTFAAFVLPERSRIDKQANELYALLNRDPQDTSTSRRSTDWLMAAQRLSEMVLAPAVRELTTKRLVFVPDGALQYIPFDALPVPAGQDLMLARFETTSLPSLSALAELRAAANSRTPAPRLAVVFADPVFEDGDPRLVRLKRTTEQSQGERIADRSRGAGTARRGRRFAFEDPTDPFAELTGLSEGINLVRLQFSGQEARAIARIAAGKGCRIALDFEVNKNAVTQSNLSDYKIVHFSTHSIMNFTEPRLSCIVLSRFDEHGQARDAFLRLNDIYNLKLNAELVVLGACQTALGKEIRGEGLASLTRGFMYAGASRVVASLWKVDDEASAELMTLFYEKMLAGESLSPAAALREARNEMGKQERWRHPYFWSGFVLQGEWR